MNKPETNLPDIIADTKPLLTGQLNWVGMEKIAVPIKFPLNNDEAVAVTAYADVFVSLDSDAKGIHMSRLYLKLQKLLAKQDVSFNRLCGLLEGMLQSQNGESRDARVSLEFDLPLVKPALLSDNFGYQAYPLKISQQLVDGRHLTFLDITIPYSSTCPCSASLARQLIAESLEKQFVGDAINKSDLVDWLKSEKSALATPHNQRSYAYVKLTLEENQWPEIVDLIVQMEEAIGTPVQTAVKREDEQAFAKLNGDNLMFCEDAARKLDGFLAGREFLKDYWFKIEHQESLHAHNAVVIHHKS